MDIDYKAIGNRMKAARLKMGITQQTLAELSGQTPTNVSHIERSNTKVSLPTLLSIANALDVTLDELICDSIKKAKVIFHNEIVTEIEDCSEKEIRIIADTIKTLKTSLRKNLE